MENFIPFGAQYYRAPTPDRTDWERDLKNFAAQGFNTIKIWAQWRWNNPSEEAYDFSDLDVLMDLAQENKLKVVINTIFDVAPAWFYQKYPESLMITADGRAVQPQATAYRQIGGAPGPCYHHEAGIEARKSFLVKTVEHFKNHPALYVWDLWNEPELTCGIYREPIQADMVCYCDRCAGKFKNWLQRKYGDITALNRHWGRNYQDFEQVELPRSGAVFADMIDWRVFFSQVLNNELKMRAQAAKSVDTLHPVMVHTVPIFLNAVNACNNDFELARYVDLFGNSARNDPFPAAMSRCCAAGKKAWSAEIHAIGGDTFGRPNFPSFEEMKSYILAAYAQGLKGFLYWQYRAETLGREAPAWGLTTIGGQQTPWLESARKICRVLQENAVLLNPAKPVPARIAVVNGFKNQIFNWCASDKVDLYVNSVMGLFHAAYDAGYNVDVVEPGMMTMEAMKQYQVVLLPFPYYIEEKTALLLKQWVAEGGMLISEALFGSVNGDLVRHVPSVPGFGFDEVFGATEGTVYTASSFKNAYDTAWSAAAGEQMIPIDLETETGGTLPGYYFCEELNAIEDQVLGHFVNGAAAVVDNWYGAGRAVWLGTLIGASYHLKHQPEIRDFLADLLAQSGVQKVVEADQPEIRADILTDEDGGKTALVLQNRASVEKAVRLTSALFNGKISCTDLFTQAVYPIAGGCLKLTLPANSNQLYQIH